MALPSPNGVVRELGTEGAISKLIFVTTGWDKVHLNTGMERERQIRVRLGLLLRLGAGMARFDMLTETAWGILDPLLRNS